jgi:hypothetical protein
MTPELLKNIQAALQAQFQAGYTTAQLDIALQAALPPVPAPPIDTH